MLSVLDSIKGDRSLESSVLRAPMGNMTAKVLLNSISRYIHLLACQPVVKLDPLLKDYKKLMDMFKLLRPMLDETIDSDIHSEELLVEFEELDLAVNEARDIVENWSPKMSKMLNVLRSESLIINVQKHAFRICQALTKLTQHPSVEHFIQELQCMEHVMLSEVIQVALRDHRDGHRPRSDVLMKIIEILGLASNQELFMESVALEKERERTQKGRTDVHHIDQFIMLVGHMRDCIINLKKYKYANVSPIPTYLCCVLSTDLMLEPVIVASGQTFERVFIQNWLDCGLRTCPKTHQPLVHCNLIPNDTVKVLISNWCEVNDVVLPPPPSLKIHHCFYSDVPSTGLDTENEAIPYRSNVKLKDTSVTATRCNLKNGSLNYQSSVCDEVGNLCLEHDDKASFQNGRGSTCMEKKLVNHGTRPKVELSVVVTNDKHNNLSSCDQSTDHSRSDSLSSTISSIDYNQGVGAEDLNEIRRVQCDSSEASEEIAPSHQVSPPNMLYEKFCSPRNILHTPTNCLSSVQSYKHEGNSASTTMEHVMNLIEGLRSQSIVSQTAAAAELRLLAKYNKENRVIIAESGTIPPLISLLYSHDKKTQENAVTALLNLSINEENKRRVADASVIEPLIHVLKTGNSEAKENSAATFFSLSVMEEYKAKIGRSGAIKPLVDLLAKGSLRGKKDAATALFNLSIFHENKVRIIQAGAVKFLVDLMLDTESGMVDKAVAVLANLSTVPEGQTTICEEGGIPALVEVVEFGSPRGKENAAASLFQLCINSHSYSTLVLQEGAVPPLVALSQAGTPRAKEKAQQILSHFRNQREAKMVGKGK